MWIIKNRVTGEYDRKGHSKQRNKVSRDAWNTLAHAKCHVADAGFDEWFLEADFIEITEEGIGRIEPVIDYLREHYKTKRGHKNAKARLGILEEE